MSMSDNELAELAQARAKVGEMLTEANAKVDAIKAKKSELDKLLLNQINDDVPTKTTAYGTIARKETDRYSVEHVATWHRFVLENEDTSMLTKAVSKEAVDAYRDANDGDLPPGVSSYTQVSLSFTKPRKAAPKRSAA